MQCEAIARIRLGLQALNNYGCFKYPSSREQSSLVEFHDMHVDSPIAHSGDSLIILANISLRLIVDNACTERRSNEFVCFHTPKNYIA